MDRYSLRNTLTFILAGGQGSRLLPLTKKHAKPAVSFAAYFRIIDYVLSNCINSGLRRIYMLTQTKSLSLHQHLQKNWQFLRSSLDEFLISVPPQQRIVDQWYNGTADAVFQNINLLQEHRPDEVFILSGDHIYNMDFNEMYQQHIDTKADVTLALFRVPKEEASRFGVVQFDKDKNITNFLEKPAYEDIPVDTPNCHVNMGIYLFKTQALVRALIDNQKNSTIYDFGQSIFPDMLGKLNMKAFLFEDTAYGDYWKDVGTIRSYYDANMEFLEQVSQRQRPIPSWPMHALGSSSFPSMILGESKISKSLIAGNSRFDSATIQSSLIGNRTTVNKNTKITNSIILGNAVIGSNCTIENAIIDEKTHIKDNQTIDCSVSNIDNLYCVSEGIVVISE